MISCGRHSRTARIALLTLLCCAVTAPAASATEAPGGWHQYGGSAARTHEAAGAYGLALYRKWCANLPAGVYSIPATGAGAIFVGCDDGALYSLDASSGAQRWSFKPESGAKFRSAPAYQGGFVVAASADGTVYCVDASSGIEKWRFPAGLSVTSPLAVSGDSALVASGDGRVLRIRMADGQPVWQYAMQGEFMSSAPCAGGGAVFVTTLGTRAEGGWVCAIDENTGALRWRTQIPGWLGNTVTFSDGKVIVASTGFKTGGVYCLDAAGGSLLWGPLCGDNNYWSPPAVSGGKVFAGNTGWLYCADLSTGAVLWRWQAPSVTRKAGRRAQQYEALVRTPIVSGSRVYVNTCFEVPGPNDVFAVSALTGATLWRNEIPARPGSGLCAGDDSIVLGGAGGEVLALSPVSVFLNGVRVAMDDSPPLILESRTRLPCRALFEAVGFRVRWNGTTRTVTCDDGQRSVVMVAGSRSATVNGGELQLEAPLTVMGGRAMAPVRAVVEALGGSVAWDPVKYAVVVRLDRAVQSTGVGLQ